MIEDTELLRRYAEQHAQDAFAELVRRRVDLVYSVALRQVGGDAHLAEDVTQKVFADLARKARPLSQRAVLIGWLYRSTQYAASDVVRSERRRRAREQESQAMHEISLDPNAAADWDRLRPLLDSAMGELSEDDRDAVALRFFEGKPFADIGRTLRLTDEAARKRVDRALDKLSVALSRRGVKSTAAALGVALGSQITMAAPAGLAASVTATALATAAGFAASAGMVVAAKIAIGAAAAAGAFAVGVVYYEVKHADLRDGLVSEAVAQRQSLEAQVAELQSRVAFAEERALAADEDVAKFLNAMENTGMRTAAASKSSVPARVVSDPQENGAIDRAMVEQRYARARELARSGHGAEALDEFLWCLDRGMPSVPSYSGVRLSFLLSEIIRLGESGRAALVERREAAEERLRAGAADYQTAADFNALNRTLGEDARTLRFYDELSAGDPRRERLGRLVYDQLLAARRYSEAAQVKSLAQTNVQFELNTRERPLPANIRDPEGLRRAHRQLAVRNAARHVEVLAGVGDLANAKALSARVLAYDNSPETKALLQQHAARAGRPELLATP